MASAYEQHIDTEKLNNIAGQLRTLKTNMDTKVEEINTTIKSLGSETAYASAEADKLKTTFEEFKIKIQDEFDKDMEAFAVFIEKVSGQHAELARALSGNIDTQLANQTNAIASQFNG